MAGAKKNDTKEEKFEAQLARLEGLVEKLEKGDIPLEESLLMFEEGVELYQLCKKRMGSIEVKINKLTESMREESLEEKE